MLEAEYQETHWRQSAPYWDKHRNVIRRMFAPITEALILEAGISPGNTVLDVGTGSGEPALRVSEVVGKQGSVCGVDPAPEMIDGARRASISEGRSNVRFEVSSADHLPFESDAFDAVVSRFAVMFFPAPLEGIREIMRVLKPGRRIAFAVWSFAENNPFHYALSQVMGRYVDSPPPQPDSPEPFRYAQPGKLRTLLSEAGAIETSERLLHFKIEAPVTVEDFWHLRSEMSDKLRAKLASLSAETREEIRGQMIAGLHQYWNGKEMSFPAEVPLIVGRKPFQ
jgi:SAM-dependent methyltransferase